jgi:hypothetical protein
MTRRLQNVVPESKLLLLILNCEADLGTVRVDDGFCMLRKGWPKIMGALASPPIFKTTKSMGTYDYPIRTMVSSRTLLG